MDIFYEKVFCGDQELSSGDLRYESVIPRPDDEPVLCPRLFYLLFYELNKTVLAISETSLFVFIAGFKLFFFFGLSTHGINYARDSSHYGYHTADNEHKRKVASNDCCKIGPPPDHSPQPKNRERQPKNY